jgi:signal transduction histidine kinase
MAGELIRAAPAPEGARPRGYTAGMTDVSARDATARHPVLRSLFTAWKLPHDGPPWAPWAWTVLLNLLIAIVLTLILPARVSEPAMGGFTSHLLISQAIGLSIHGLFHATWRWLGLEMFAMPVGLRLGYVAVIVIAGTWIGFSAAVLLVTAGDLERTSRILGSSRGSLVLIPLFWGLFALALFAAIGRLQTRQLAAERARGDVARAEREAIAARLALLSAQIEPHFLYNTLAHVRALAGADAAAAQRMLDALIAYLRASSRNMARALVPLDDELGSVRGYLAVMQQRLGARLAVRWEIPERARSLAVPPAALQTLVENAIKHGIEPAAAGGTITVRALVDADAWRLEVLDTGAGFGPRADGRSEGTGLANLRERLRLALGEDAGLVLEREADQTGARLRLPIVEADL